MCGIAGIVLKQKNLFSLSEKISAMTDAIAHRGPDGEGFMLADINSTTPYYRSFNNYNSQLNYIPKKALNLCSGTPFMALGHRRLSIIDLTESGHQPMSSQDQNYWIVFNGEIYNYIEIKKELSSAGHQFYTGSDTEVVLAAYKQWGFDCVSKFNGMWAFCIFDKTKGICFASRDRLGVKPFYYLNNSELFSFASEQKAFTSSGLIKAEINSKALHNYLINGQLETETNNFFEGVQELFPGNNLVYKINEGKLTLNKYYSIKPNNDNDGLSESDLIEKIREQLMRSVTLRMRCDVEVGNCLSGGIDSSVLSGLMHKVSGKEIFCFTSVFKGQSFNEENFADIVAKKIRAKHKKVEPDESGFLKELDDLIYSQDVPIWDTSTYAQYKVMQLAKQNNIKVVLDGQGADELFAGYHHHFIAKWNNLFSNNRSLEALNEIKASAITIESPFVFYLKEKIKQKWNVDLSTYQKVFNQDFIQSHQVENPSVYFNSVNEQLLNDINKVRLKSFLKCEDRCGMWHSVESRTPFSDDIDLMNLMFSFNGNKKIKKGVSKFLLREAGKDILPKEIYSRYDKKGFETPMLQWLKNIKPIMSEEILGLNLEIVDKKKILAIDENNFKQMKILFKLFVIARWKKVFEKTSIH